MAKKTCFVIMGFGPKVDPETRRTLDLDKTFENLIQPVFQELKIECFRAKDIRHTGTIDLPMYEWIYKADIVVADLSTLNPNALYELGVRHALRPFSTIVISENQLKYPFDISHTVIESYEHLGTDIGVTEANRFKKELKLKVETVLKTKKRDSPVYTFLSNLNPPSFNVGEIKQLKEKENNSPSLSDLAQDAENAKNKKDYIIAAEIYKVCLKFEPNNVFFKQRLALVTYKSKKPNVTKALLEAEKIINSLNPNETIDVETLGLSGAISKRLFELLNNEKYLDKALGYYEKGFIIQQDYYNGINYAYCLTVKSSLQKNKNHIESYFLQSDRVRLSVENICTKLIKSSSFKERDDKEWVLQSLGQAYLGMNKQKEFMNLMPKIESLSKGEFDLDTFHNQNKKLKDLISEIKRKLSGKLPLLFSK